jgi:hypothetical protein
MVEKRVLILSRSPNPAKKWRVRTPPGVKPARHVDFGQKGASDFTMHHDHARMLRYVARHGGGGAGSRSSSKEKWGLNGLWTAGFWSRWLLWSASTMSGAKALMKSRFGITLTTSKSSGVAKKKAAKKKRVLKKKLLKKKVAKKKVAKKRVVKKKVAKKKVAKKRVVKQKRVMKK